MQGELRALIQAKDSAKAEEYDLEETVRILNSLSVAMEQADDYNSFLVYMSKQDYSRVPAEVVDAEAKILPIIDKLIKLDKEYADISLWRTLVKNSKGNNSDNSEKKFSFSCISQLDEVLPVVMLSKTIDQTKEELSKAFEENEELKKMNRAEKDIVTNAYVEYLKELTPIYNKYMKEWNDLCLCKDHAYMSAYSGRMDEVYNTTNTILSKYPRNREALLLHAMSAIYSQESVKPKIEDNTIPTIKLNDDSVVVGSEQSMIAEAKECLSKYIKEYPDKSAPALLLSGIAEYKSGNTAQALTLFDQASMEYPRQAEALNDLLDSYRQRTYLNSSAEGMYLLNLYHSTMLGYGLFSPNFNKAKIYTEEGNMAKAQEEIYNHFFRRGNQVLHNGILTDMTFCETNLAESFNQFVVEKSYIDIKLEPETKYLVATDNKTVKVTLVNRSDIAYENVSAFVCLHFTGMHKDDYFVLKTNAKSKLPANDSLVLGSYPLEYNNKTYDDITRCRAVVMTDNKICWVDQTNIKESEALASVSMTKIAEEVSNNLYWKNELLSSDYFKQKIAESIKAEASKTGLANVMSGIVDISDSREVTVELPRILAMIAPSFRVGDFGAENEVKPKSNVVSGKSIKLKFSIDDFMKRKEMPLYIYSPFMNFKVDMQTEGESLKVKNVSICGGK